MRYLQYFTGLLIILGSLWHPPLTLAETTDETEQFPQTACSINRDDRNLVITAQQVCGTPPYRVDVTVPGWTFSISSHISVPCGGTVTFTQRPKNKQWAWLAGTYGAVVYKTGDARPIATCGTRFDQDQGGIVAPGDRFSLPEDPTHFKGLPLFALFGGGLAPGAIGLLSILLALGLIASFIFFVLGAFKYMVSRGDPKQVEAARNQITSAIIGLVIMAASFFIVQVIQRMLGIQVTG